MKIAIVAPSPVPFGVGGAEKLWWGMLEFINRYTTHQCELIKIPVKENNFWDLVDSYHTFYNMDLSYFDMVISTKYPAWMIQHHNHHIYLQHCLRGLYDTYHFSGLPLEYSGKHPNVNKTIALMKKEDSSIEDIFNALFELKKDKSVPDDTYDFPAPFIRQIIHCLDHKTMQNITKFSAISQTVINRKEYFPKNSQVSKIYHPSNLTEFTNLSSSYFFTVSRLDEAKRIEVIVAAYMKSHTKIALKIAGTGPLSSMLKDRIKNDSRIELLGFVSDKELMEHYSRAYAILFIPYDEDYGLITIEAMMCEKPVLTFNDAGGVLEFVEDGVTGLVCEPHIEKLAYNIDYITDHEILCETMGKAAKERVVNITWKNTIENLLGEVYRKNKITVVTTYPIYPPRGGGQNRVFYLYKELAKSMIVDVVCLVNESETYTKNEVAPNLFEIRVPKTKVHRDHEWEIEKRAGIPVTDIAMLYHYNDTPLFRESIERSYKDSDYLIATQPYTYNVCKSITTNLIHDSQNVEYLLKKQMLKETPYNQGLLDKLFDAEKEACVDGLFTMVCAMDDAQAMKKLYTLDSSKAVLVPNGVDLHSVSYTSKEKRYSIKQSLGLAHQKIILFIGSWHQPNIDAVEEIFKIAQKLPSYYFIIIGNVDGYFASHAIPDNIGLTGVTDDVEKEIYLSIVDIAINPMLSGSGTNLKMLDYMLSGIPVISTEVGARGLNIPEGYIVQCHVTDFTESILNISDSVDMQKSSAFVEKNFSWEFICKNLLKALRKHSVTY